MLFILFALYAPYMLMHSMLRLLEWMFYLLCMHNISSEISVCYTILQYTGNYYIFTDNTWVQLSPFNKGLLPPFI